jgi:hypothetical protein
MTPKELKNPFSGRMLVYIDQYGQKVWAQTVKELRERAGGGRVFKIYVDKVAGEHAGKTVHCGYGVGHRCFYAYALVEVEVSQNG